MKLTRDCDPLERMVRSLILLDALCYHQEAFEVMEITTPEEKFVHNVYCIAHAAAGHCGNPHLEWLDMVDELAKDLDKTNTLRDLEKHGLKNLREQLFLTIQGVDPMGIFDSMTIEYELEVGLPENGWQTKCLDCDMSSFVLTRDGRLLQKVAKMKIVDGMAVATTKSKTIDRNFEGSFNVYQMIDKVWHEFDITMIDGEVKLVRKKEPCGA